MKHRNRLTADRQELVDRVTHLTSALVKQKAAISKLKEKEWDLLTEQEHLQKKIRLLEGGLAETDH